MITYTDDQLLEEALRIAQRLERPVEQLAQEDWLGSSEIPLEVVVDRLGWSRMKRLATRRLATMTLVERAQRQALGRLEALRGEDVRARGRMAIAAYAASELGLAKNKIADALAVSPQGAARLIERGRTMNGGSNV